jgi:hypothetical protein
LPSNAKLDLPQGEVHGDRGRLAGSPNGSGWFPVADLDFDREEL